MSELEDILYFQISGLGLPIPEREYRFCAEYVGLGAGLRERLAAKNLKDNRFDFCWPDRKIAVEVEGGGFVNGRHIRPLGFEKDLIKYETALRMGYIVFRCSGKMVRSGEAIKTIEILLGVREYD
jgi:hypothetical protein